MNSGSTKQRVCNEVIVTLNKYYFFLYSVTKKHRAYNGVWLEMKTTAKFNVFSCQKDYRTMFFLLSQVLQSMNYVESKFFFSVFILQNNVFSCFFSPVKKKFSFSKMLFKNSLCLFLSPGITKECYFLFLLSLGIFFFFKNVFSKYFFNVFFCLHAGTTRRRECSGA